MQEQHEVTTQLSESETQPILTLEQASLLEAINNFAFHTRGVSEELYRSLLEKNHLPSPRAEQLARLTQPLSSPKLKDNREYQPVGGGFWIGKNT